jgi:hypothetical protein
MKKQKAVSKFPLTAFFAIQGEGMCMILFPDSPALSASCRNIELPPVNLQFSYLNCKKRCRKCCRANLETHSKIIACRKKSEKKKGEDGFPLLSVNALWYNVSGFIHPEGASHEQDQGTHSRQQSPLQAGLGAELYL